VRFDDHSPRFVPRPRGIPPRSHEPWPTIGGIPVRPDPQAEPPRRAADTSALTRIIFEAYGLENPSIQAKASDAKVVHHLGALPVRDNRIAIEAVTAAYREQVQTHALSFNEFVRERRVELSGRSPIEIATLYANYIAPAFSGVPSELASILNAEVPAFLSDRTRWEHTYIVAATGQGKSELLKSLIYTYVTLPNSAAVVVIDPAGDMVEQIAHWPEFVGNDRLVYVHPRLATELTPTINPFAFSSIDPNDTSQAAVDTKRVLAQQLLSAFEEVIAGGQGSHITLNMSTLLMPCILTLLDYEGATLRELQRFMDDERNGDLVAFGASRAHHPDVARFFAEDFSDKRRFGATKGSISTKLQSLFNTGFFTDLTCGPSTIDLERALERRQVILFNLSKGLIGETESQAFGRLLVAMLQGIAMRRAEQREERRVPVHAFIDECHNYITASVRTILLEQRKYRLFLTLCQQIIGENMSGDMSEVITGSCAVQATGYARPLHQRNAAALVQIEPSDIALLGRGDFYMRVGKHPAFRFSGRKELIGFSHRMAEPTWRVVASRQLRAYYRPRKMPIETTSSSPVDVPPTRRKRPLL
jgi:hypothetical protein